jgi:hypothetical protein
MVLPGVDNSTSTLEWHQIAGKTVQYSVVCSSGFLFALALTLFIYRMMRTSTKSGEADPLLWYDLGPKEDNLAPPPNPAEDLGRFGKFMICVELLDAIPEAAIIADATVEGSISWSFVLAICTLNICNGLATAMDFLSNNSDMSYSRSQDSIRVCLFVFIFFAIGILSYSISADIYADFVDKYDDSTRGSDHLLLLMGGTIVGGFLIATLMRVEDWLHHKSAETEKIVVKPTFLVRACQCLALFLIIFFWTIALSFGLAAIFWLFVEHNKSAYIESALEGLSGGAFLATVAGTMIPRIHEDANMLHWPEVKKRLVGVCLFELGIMCGVAIDVLT